MLSFLKTAVLGGLAAASLVSAQDISSANNVTSLYGTWSSGVGNVQTGLGFANPLNYSFTYPKTTGISYSFTDDGFFEEAQYRFNSNASLPNCIQAYVLWQHGTYKIYENSSLVLYPFAADGRIQVQDPCAAETNVIVTYNQQTLYSDWGIQIDALKNNYALQLAKFDGSPMPPLYLVARPPNMLPTVQLVGYGENATTISQGNERKRSFSSWIAPPTTPNRIVRRSVPGQTGALSPKSMTVVNALGVAGVVLSLGGLWKLNRRR